MPRCKRLTALVVGAALLAALLTGCGQSGDGVTLSVCVGGAVESLDPIYATSTGDQTILMQMYENLMRVTVDVSGETTVTNGMAKSVTQEESYDGTVTWTFRLRNAKWSDGKSVTAADFVYAWQRLADPTNDSPYADLLSVVAGYEDARESGDMTLLQVSAKNDSTLVVVLNGQYDWFLEEVCTAPATLPLRQDVLASWEAALAEETPDTAGEDGAPEADTADTAAQVEPWWSDPAAQVTNGPYLPAVLAEPVTLTANERYYGHSGPDQLAFYFADTAEGAWQLYEDKTVDLVGTVPESRLAELLDQEDPDVATELGAYTVLYNCDQDPLTDALVRQALDLAIDRAAAAEAAGIGAQAAEGLVPSGVPESDEADFRATGGALLDNDPEGYAERCAQAAEALSEAGRDGGQGELEYLYVDEGSNAAVAETLAEMWRSVLGLRVVPRAVTQEELLEALESGTYTLAGLELVPLGNDAECILMQWCTENRYNYTRYSNSAYDTLLAIIAGATDGTARMGCLHDAEALLLEDHVLSPLYTRATGWELRNGYAGICRDARGWFCLSGAAVVDQ